MVHFNTKKIIAALFLIVGAVITLQAQQATLSPVPQVLSWGEAAFDSSAAYHATGIETADSDATALLAQRFTLTGGNIQLLIGERGDEAIASYEPLIPQKEEGYYLKITADSVIIAGYDGSGTYYGVQTFLQIASMPTVQSVVISDYPDVTERGLVEGYYGNPYSETDRLRMFDFFGKQKMNVYIYGPKDDPYHKANWRTNYPAAQAKKITEYVETAKKNKVTFVWAIHPGGDIKWNKTDSTNMINKLKAMYGLGVRAFAVFFDDIGGDGTDPNRQAGLLNYITQEIVNKYDDVKPLIMCPTQYNKSWSSGSYLSNLGTKSDAGVRIMWTGNSVVDMIDNSDMTWINGQIKRKAYIWLNYPVNDYCISHLLMGPTYGNSLTIASQLGGFTSNPMEYAEASKVSLFSIADYTWNMSDYKPNDSWEKAIRYLMPLHSEAFHLFCENNIDLGSTYHGLRRNGESPRFTEASKLFGSTIAAGDTATATAQLREHFKLMIDAVDSLTTCGESPELMTEITPWCQVMKYVALKGNCLMDMYDALAIASPDSFINSYLRYQAYEEKQTAIRSRNFSGSIKSPNPVVATTFIVPFLKSGLATLISKYKESYKYRLDVFPAQLLENGRYFIMINGKYLTNEKENVLGSVPHFLTRRDDVKPQRQEWLINIDPATERYKIINAQDNRYLNETGAFASSNTNNPYEAVWHTYNIMRLANGKYSIQNAGSAGSKFWGVDSDTTRVKQSSVGAVNPSVFIFDIVPVEAENDEPVIESGEVYYIKEGDKYLTNTNVRGSGGTPTFRTVKTPAKAHEWLFSIDSNGGYYKIESNADRRYLNEYGVFGTNSYYSDWNTYLILELGGYFSIQTTQQSGTHFWNSNGTRLQQDGALNLASSYVINIVSKKKETGIIATPFTLDDNRIIVKDGEVNIGIKKVKKITIYNSLGQKCLMAANSSHISVSQLRHGLYIVAVQTDNARYTAKIIVEQQ